MGRYFCKQISLFWLNNRDVQGRNEVRWHPGVRKKFGQPMFEPEVFQKQMYCFEKCAYGIVVTFYLPAVIRRPGYCVPLPPLVTSLVLFSYSIKIGKFSDNNKFSSPNVMNFYSINVCSFRTQYRMDLAQTDNKGYWQHFKFLRVAFVSLLRLPHSFFSTWTCACFSNNKTFTKFNKLLS